MINGPAGYDPIQGGMRTEMKAGPGIDISNGTISTTGEAGVPYIGGTGINITGATVETDLTAGYRMEIISGATIGQVRYMPVETVTGSSVTMQAGHAYKIYATSAAITLNTETIPANFFGLEGHLEIFVAGTGYVVTGSNVVLANALEPDAVNNCTVRFHDGLAIISVEDHVAGYIVVSATGSTAGTLPYALSSASQEYIAFDASLNGSTFDMGGAVTNGEKHVVGNGYNETVVSGGINCTSKTTFSNLGMNGVVVSSGTLTMGDVFIPSGATVSVSGGGLAVEKVTGNGGTIDLGGYSIDQRGDVTVSGCTIANGSNSNTGGGIFLGSTGLATYDFFDCTITGGVTTKTYAPGGGIYIIGYQNSTEEKHARFSNCVVSGNSSYSYGYSDIAAGYDFANIELLGGNTVGVIHTANNAHVFAFNYNKIEKLATIGNGGTFTIASGAVLDLTGNENLTPINPGGGITFEAGGATVYPSAGQASAYMLGGMTVPTIGNTNVIGLSSTYAYVSSNTSAVASNAIFSGGFASATNGGAVVMGASASFSAFDCVFDKNSGYNAGGMIAPVEGCTLVLSGCTATNNDAYNGGGVFLFSGASGELVSCTMSGNKGYTAGALHVNAGASVSLSGCTITGNIASSAFGGGLNAYGNANISACTISGNSQGDIRITSNTVLIKDSTVGLIATSGGTVTFEGTNTLASAGGGTGTVIISGGASITLTSSIAPGGGITVLTGGATVNGNAIPAGTYTSIDSNGQPT